MIMRLTAKLAKKIHAEPACVLPLEANPYADWSARLFVVNRVQYILVTNTASLFSVVQFAKGLIDDNRFLQNVVNLLREVLADSGYASQYERLIAPNLGVVRYSKALNRSVTGSMNDLESLAAYHLASGEISPYDASLILNKVPMGQLGYATGNEAFAALEFKPAPGESVSDQREAKQVRSPKTFPFPLHYTEVYQFKITLCETEPFVWRRIQVPGCYSFWDLHCAIIDAFGWLDYHLHLFTIHNPATGADDHFGIPDADDDPMMGYTVFPGWKMRLSRLFTPENARADYLYDFGDGWHHEVVLEAVLPRSADTTYPRCVDGENACPPEDCGGVPGFSRFKKSISRHNAKDHDDLLAWAGGWYDPGWFDRGIVEFSDPRLRWEIAFLGKKVPGHLRILQYHRMKQRES
ncbi:MAG: plasmid pRiA4b ORF-3 family protein [bacterium]